MTTTAIFYDDVLKNSNYQKAKDRAKGLDWQSIDSKKDTYPYLKFMETINGVGIWYNYGHDAYYFSDETKNNED